jgi:hypothetical protein
MLRRRNYSPCTLIGRFNRNFDKPSATQYFEVPHLIASSVPLRQKD